MFLRTFVRHSSFVNCVRLCGIVHGVTLDIQKSNALALKISLITQCYNGSAFPSSLGGLPSTAEQPNSQAPVFTAPPTIPPSSPKPDNTVDTLVTNFFPDSMVVKESHTLYCFGTNDFIKFLRLAIKEDTILSIVGSVRGNTKQAGFGSDSRSIIFVYQEKLRSMEHMICPLKTSGMPLLSVQNQIKQAIFDLPGVALKGNTETK
ncbi:unnamed protein product [Phytomonas sp. Hart1]|nr:unnamed protein product [Phytomonas sp. Hart1]|eukprot:CCW72178.1 unnamed protein product [Phytomonas sp. isolate Hart1]